MTSSNMAPLKSCMKSGQSSFGEEDQYTGSRFLKRVWFDHVRVIELPIILGDNPSPCEGVPITVGWKAQDIESFDVDEFEVRRQNHRRSGQKKLRISPQRRTELALISGSSLNDISNTCYKMADIQLHRAKASKKTTMEAIKDKLKAMKKPSSRFTKVPSEAKSVIKSWTNAAA